MESRTKQIATTASFGGMSNSAEGFSEGISPDRLSLLVWTAMSRSPGAD